MKGRMYTDITKFEGIATNTNTSDRQLLRARTAASLLSLNRSHACCEESLPHTLYKSESKSTITLAVVLRFNVQCD